MSKKTAPKTPKKPRVFRSVDEVKKAYFPKKYAEDMKALNDKIDLMDSRLRTLNAWETMQDAMEESRSAPAEEWVPKAGDYVTPAIGMDTMDEPYRVHNPWEVGEVKEVGANALVKWPSKPVAHWYSYELNARIKPATDAEIADHKAKEEQRALEAEWKKYDVLQVQDACHVAPHEAAELLCLAKPIKGLMRHDYSPMPEWAKLATFDDGNCFGFGSVPDTYDAGKHWTIIPFAEFLRRLQGTIAKRAEEERAKELAKPLDYGTHVKLSSDVNTGAPFKYTWRVACPVENGRGQICLVSTPIDAVPTYVHLKRHEFTIID